MKPTEEGIEKALTAVIEKASGDAEYRERVLADPEAAIREAISGSAEAAAEPASVAQELGDDDLAGIAGGVAQSGGENPALLRLRETLVVAAQAFPSGSVRKAIECLDRNMQQ